MALMKARNQGRDFLVVQSVLHRRLAVHRSLDSLFRGHRLVQVAALRLDSQLRLADLPLSPSAK
jgi:hypothetical protein